MKQLKKLGLLAFLTLGLSFSLVSCDEEEVEEVIDVLGDIKDLNDLINQ